MSVVEQRTAPARRASTGTIVWFFWMLAMWVAFFVLLFAGALGSLWHTVTQWPLVVELVAWVALFPWMLATWVWTGTWDEPLRIAAVVAFAVGWTILSIPAPWRRRMLGVR